MPTISPVQSSTNSAHLAADAREVASSKLLDQSPADQDKVKSTFQDFAAGTFYKEMMKSLRKMHNKPAYMYGGHAEEVFQGQMDQEIAESMAHSKGSQISDPLFKGFLNHAGNR